jgi:hypothetical protein
VRALLAVPTNGATECKRRTLRRAIANAARTRASDERACRTTERFGQRVDAARAAEQSKEKHGSRSVFCAGTSLAGQVLRRLT